MGNNNENQSEKQEKLVAESHSRMLEREKESKVVKKIVLSIISVLLVLVVILGFVGYRYVSTSLEPLDPKSEKKYLSKFQLVQLQKKLQKF